MMNERIRELAKEAGYYLYDLTETHECKTVETDSKDEWITLEKFAELIVKECLAHGKLTQSQVVVNGSEEYNAGREMGIEVFMNQIKKHFGLEQ